MKTTQIYGASDDLIEFEGGLTGEISGNFDPDEDKQGLIVCSDGTLLSVAYGKDGEGIWEMKLLQRGTLFDRIDICTDSDAEIYSDISHFSGALKWAYVASAWERVK